MRILVTMTLTAVVVPLSWHFFESPINELKRLFPYVLVTLVVVRWTR